MRKFNCFGYTDSAQDSKYFLCNVPETWALRIDLDHARGDKTVLIYNEMPDEEEQMDLMLHLQINAGRHNFTVTRIEQDGTKIDCPALNPEG